MEEIRRILLDYKKCTVNIVKLLEKDEFASLQSEIERRQCILDKLISFQDKREEAKKTYEELQIGEFQTQAEELIRIKSSDVKKKLGNISRNKKATNAYGRLGRGATIFSKKI